MVKDLERAGDYVKILQKTFIMLFQENLYTMRVQIENGEAIKPLKKRVNCN